MDKHDLERAIETRIQSLLESNAGDASVDSITDAFRGVLLLFASADLLEALNILDIEQGSITSIDRKEQAIVNPLMNRLPADSKACAKIGHGEQGVRTLLLKETQQRGMCQRAQWRALPLQGKAKALRGQWITIEATSEKVYRHAHIFLIRICIAFSVVSNGSKTHTSECSRSV